MKLTIMEAIDLLKSRLFWLERSTVYTDGFESRLEIFMKVEEAYKNLKIIVLPELNEKEE